MDNPFSMREVRNHCHARGLQVIYHGCGNVHAVIGDFAEMGIDAYNPLRDRRKGEWWSGMDEVFHCG